MNDILTPNVSSSQNENFEDCEMCEGEGTRLYPAVFIDGDLYQDGEVLECDECNGTGKVLTTQELFEKFKNEGT